MGWTLPETKMIDLSPAKNRAVEKDYMDFRFGKIPPESRPDGEGFGTDRTSYFWNAELKCWQKEIEIKPPDPKYHTFLVYGEFSYGEKKLNFFLVRIPYKGVNWHKKVVPNLRKISNTLAGKNKSRWNVDTYNGIDKTWEKSDLPVKRFYWRGTSLVQKRKGNHQ